MAGHQQREAAPGRLEPVQGGGEVVGFVAVRVDKGCVTSLGKSDQASWQAPSAAGDGVDQRHAERAGTMLKRRGRGERDHDRCPTSGGGLGGGQVEDMEVGATHRVGGLWPDDVQDGRQLRRWRASHAGTGAYHGSTA